MLYADMYSLTMRNDIWTVFVHSPISLPLCSYFVNCVKYCVCQCFIKELLDLT